MKQTPTLFRLYIITTTKVTHMDINLKKNNGGGLDITITFDNEDEKSEVIETIIYNSFNGWSDFQEFCEVFMTSTSPFNNGWFFGTGENYPIGLTEAPFITD